MKGKHGMNNNDNIIKDTLKKLCNNNTLPQEKLNQLTQDINSLKKTIEPLSKQELDLLLKALPENKVQAIKNQII